MLSGAAPPEETCSRQSVPETRSETKNKTFRASTTPPAVQSQKSARGPPRRPGVTSAPKTKPRTAGIDRSSPEVTWNPSQHATHVPAPLETCLLYTSDAADEE